MRRWLALVLIAIATPALAQSAAGPLGSSSKALLPRSITEAGGEFQVDEAHTLLEVKPYAEAFEANMTVRCTGKRGNVRYASFILNGGRRATDVTENNVALPFTHAGDFLTVQLKRPLAEGTTRTFRIRYTGKAHSVSSRWIKDYKIDQYTVEMRVLPLTGNLTATASLVLVGQDPPNPPKPAPTRWPGVRRVPHWVPPMLQPQSQTPKLGLLLNNHYAVEEVTMSGQPTKYRHANGVVTLDLGNALQKGEMVPVSVAFTGKIRNSDRNRLWDNFDNERRPSNALGAE